MILIATPCLEWGNEKDEGTIICLAVYFVVVVVVIASLSTASSSKPKHESQGVVNRAFFPYETCDRVNARKEYAVQATLDNALGVKCQYRCQGA